MVEVSVVMGSKSDWQVMKKCCDILDLFGISYEKRVVSAHRTPEDMVDFAKNCCSKVIVAGAGGAAHLPGMIASLTTTPVIGVPIDITSLNGLDSLLSIVQMPSGVPVACVAINGSVNAAMLAARFLSVEDKILLEKLKKYYSETQNRVRNEVL